MDSEELELELSVFFDSQPMIYKWFVISLRLKTIGFFSEKEQKEVSTLVAKKQTNI